MVSYTSRRIKKVAEEFKTEEADTEEPEKEKQEILEELLELTRINQKILRSPEILMPPDYLNEVLREKGDKQAMMFYDEYRHFNKELEHMIYRLKELVDRYSGQKMPVDEELDRKSVV